MNIGDCYGNTVLLSTSDILLKSCRAATRHRNVLKNPRVALRSTRGYSHLTATRSQRTFSFGTGISDFQCKNPPPEKIASRATVVAQCE
jgi:hypothetical protein